MECGLTKPASLRLDVEGPDHLAPLVGLFGDELTEVGGRACKQYAAHFSQPCLDLRVSKARVDCVVEFLDEFGRRVLGCTETQPRAGLVTCYELANRRNIRQSLQARCIGHRQRAQPAGPDVFDCLCCASTQPLPLSTKEIGNRGPV